MFLKQLGSAQAERMAKVGVKGKVVTLKVWRAVENAPDKFMKVGECECTIMFFFAVMVYTVFVLVAVVLSNNK